MCCVVLVLPDILWSPWVPNWKAAANTHWSSRLGFLSQGYERKMSLAKKTEEDEGREYGPALAKIEVKKSI
jgi:hypothetical protein